METDRKNASPWLFFALAFFLSWLFWVPAAVISRGKSSSVLQILFLLGGFGPSISGVVLVHRTQDGAGRRDFWQRVFSFRRIGRRWYAFISLAFPVLALLSVSMEVVAGKSVPFFPYLAALVAEPLLVIWLPVMALQIALLGSLSEELGWRGYAIDTLQARWSALASSLVVGFFWSLWHLPLFFIRDGGNFYYEWGFGTVLFWLFLLRMTLLSVIVTWVYNNNRRSILSAILLHFAYNFTFNLVYPVPETMHLYGTVLILITVIVVVIVWGPQTLAHRGVSSLEWDT